MLYKGIARTSDSALKFKIWTRKATHFPTRYMHISVGIDTLVQVPVEATRGHQIPPEQELQPPNIARTTLGSVKGQKGS